MDLINELYDTRILQYKNRGHQGEADIVIGLDFGTSASKVVIQAHGLPGNPAYAVDFGSFAHDSMPYLLPTRLWVSGNGTCHLEPQNGSPISDIKIRLFLDNSGSFVQSGSSENLSSPEPIAVAYLALLIRFSRSWFLKTKHDLIGHLSALRWGVNLGVPSPCIEENEENARFRRVGMAAWLLSLTSGEISLVNAEKELRHIDACPDYFETDPDNLACDFAIIPEIAAGAIGYAFSDLRRDGLHLMIDVGASTIDVCSFVLRNPKETGTDQYNLLTASVRPFGTVELHHERVQAISEAYSNHAAELLNNHDPTRAISAESREYLLSEEIALKAIAERETRFKTECVKSIRIIVRDAWMRRDPNAQAWKTQLPVLLIGGGSRLGFFREIVDELSPWLKDCKHNNGTEQFQVSIPQGVCEKTSEHDRLIVAWGLSHQEFNIGEIVPADEIADVDPRPVTDRRNRFVDKDQV